MEVKKYEPLVRELNRLVGEEAPTEQIVAKAREAKLALMNQLATLSTALNAIDALIGFSAPDAQWEYGWAIPKQTSSRPSRAPIRNERQRKTLEIAASLIEGGDKTISSKFIALKLRNEGDNTPVKALSTGVGNILSRSGEWRRASPGTYEPITREEN